MKNKAIYKIITLLIPVLVLAIFMLKQSIYSLVPFIPPCILYSRFHLYCPGCGNTRSVMALLDGDILSSLHYNIEPLLLLIISIAAYIELATYSFGKHIRVLPRTLSFYLIGIALLCIYLILRNFIPVLTP